jgi:predicted protein tyrosine phosphatase
MLKSSRNALHNVTNNAQGTSKRVLCVCSAGLLRSPTAANVLHQHLGYNTRAAGCYDYALIPLSTALVEWAQEIVCMEEEHKQSLIWQWEDAGEEGACLPPIVVLNIGDYHNYGTEKLSVEILKAYAVCQPESN